MITLDLSIINQKGTPMFNSDTLALRPAFGIVGRIFIDIASPYGIYRDTGTAWDQIAGSGGGGIGGSGTATQIAYFTGASSIASSVNLFWDNTNARLGINTATPSSSLDVHSTSQAIIQANNTTLGNAFLTFLLQDVGKWQLGNVYNAGANYFRIRDQLNSLERFTIQNTGQIDFLGWQQTLNTVTGITGTTPSALPNSSFTNNFTFNSGIITSASVNAIGVLVDNVLNYSGANTINATSYNASGLFRIGLTFGSATASITYTQGATAQIRALTSNQLQYIQNGNNSGTISHFANIQILGDNRSGTGFTTFTNRYGLLINDFNDFGINNTYTNRWGIYQQGVNENNYFAGKITTGISNITSAFQLDVTGNSNSIARLWNGTYGLQFNNQAVGGLQVYGGISGTSVTLPSTTNYGLFISNSGNHAGINSGQGTDLQLGGTTRLAVYFNTGNIIIQNGGTFTDIPSARLIVNSTTQGFLPPRMTTTQKNAISTPVAGLVIYDTTLNKLCVYTTAWETVTSI